MGCSPAVDIRPWCALGGSKTLTARLCAEFQSYNTRPVLGFDFSVDQPRFTEFLPALATSASKVMFGDKWRCSTNLQTMTATRRWWTLATAFSRPSSQLCATLISRLKFGATRYALLCFSSPPLTSHQSNRTGRYEIGSQRSPSFQSITRQSQEGESLGRYLRQTIASYFPCASRSFLPAYKIL